jgi:hypothetical protein
MMLGIAYLLRKLRREKAQFKKELLRLEERLGGSATKIGEEPVDLRERSRERERAHNARRVHLENIKKEIEREIESLE